MWPLGGQAFITLLIICFFLQWQSNFPSTCLLCAMFLSHLVNGTMWAVVITLCLSIILWTAYILLYICMIQLLLWNDLVDIFYVGQKYKMTVSSYFIQSKLYMNDIWSVPIKVLVLLWIGKMATATGQILGYDIYEVKFFKTISLRQQKLP